MNDIKRMIHIGNTGKSHASLMYEVFSRTPEQMIREMIDEKQRFMEEHCQGNDSMLDGGSEATRKQSFR